MDGRLQNLLGPDPKLIILWSDFQRVRGTSQSVSTREENDES